MRTRRFFPLSALFTLAFASPLAFPTTAHADGVLFGTSAISHASRTDIHLTIADQVATTVSEMSFPCCGGEPSRLVAKLPVGASVIGFEVFQNGAWKPATIANGAPAQPSDTGPGQYSADDFDLYLGEEGFTIDLPALGGEEVRARLTTLGLATYELGQVSYVLPVDPAPAGTAQSGEVTVQVTVRSDRAFAGYSGDLDGESLINQGPEGGENVLTVSYDAAEAQKPFHFSYAVDEAPGLYAKLVTDHERCSEAGFFLLLVEPASKVSEDAVQPKAFSFVMDHSGSMQGAKMSQAKEAAQIGVDLLNPQDNFNVISFSTEVSTLFPAPQPNDASSQAKAKSFINKQVANGGTNISDALTTALTTSIGDDRARIVVFLTDGQPTDGITNPNAIIASMNQHNTSNARVFAFGIGTDVNKQLLKNVATASGGEARFLAANADLSAELGAFLQSVSRPVLLDATTSFSTVTTSETYPEGTQDLFAGRQLLLIGRYESGGVATGSLTGTLDSAPQTYTFSADFPDCSLNAAPFLPRLWAKAKIDSLLAKLAGAETEDPAIVSEIQKLSADYGIQTPYAGYGLSNDPTRPTGSTGSTGSSNSPSGYASGGLEDQAGCSLAPGGPGRPRSQSTAGLLLAGLALLGRRARQAIRARKALSTRDRQGPSGAEGPPSAEAE